MTTRDERMDRMTEVSDNISEQTREDVLEQGKKCGANMLLLYGGKTCADAGAFVHCLSNAHEAALLWLLSEGYVTLTEKAQATEDEIATRRNHRKLALKNDPSEGERVLATAGPGAYL